MNKECLNDTIQNIDYISRRVHQQLENTLLKISLTKVIEVSRWMDKKAMVHIHNGVLLSHYKNTFESVLMRWMKLEPIIQSEVSQKEKHQYSILTHTYGI